MPSILKPLLELWFVNVVFVEELTGPLNASAVVVRSRGEYVSILGISGGIDEIVGIVGIEVVVYNTGLWVMPVLNSTWLLRLDMWLFRRDVLWDSTRVISLRELWPNTTLDVPLLTCDAALSAKSDEIVSIDGPENGCVKLFGLKMIAGWVSCISGNDIISPIIFVGII